MIPDHQAPVLAVRHSRGDCGLWGGGVRAWTDHYDYVLELLLCVLVLYGVVPGSTCPVVCVVFYTTVPNARSPLALRVLGRPWTTTGSIPGGFGVALIHDH